MSRGRVIACLVRRSGLLVALGAVACRPSAQSQVATPSNVAVTPCPPGQPAPRSGDATPFATLTIALRPQPSAPTGAQATVVVDAENGRTTSHIAVEEPLQLAIPKGVAIVRVLLPGYVTTEGRAPVSAGCVATMTVTLPKVVRR